MMDTDWNMAGARRLRPVAPACHVGANAHLPNRHARRQRLNRCADEERQCQANRQETFRDRRHAAKTWAADERGSTLLGGSDIGIVSVSEPRNDTRFPGLTIREAASSLPQRAHSRR